MTETTMAPEAGTPPSEAEPTFHAWYAVVLLSVAYTFSYIDRQILSLLIEPIRVDLGINDTQIGLLGGIAFALFYTIMGIPIARMADRYSRRWIIVIGVACWSIATCLCGLARSFGALFLARVGVGVGEAALSPAAYSMISDMFPPAKIGRAMSIYTQGAALGIGLAFLLGGAILQVVSAMPPIILPLVGELRAWQVAFILVGAPGLLIALVLLTIKEPARRPSLVAPEGAVVEPEAHATLGELAAFFRERWVLLTALIGGVTVYNIAANGILIWLPTHFIRAYEWSPSEIGYAFGLALLTFGVAGMHLAGWAGDKLKAGGRIQRFLMLMGIWGLLSAPLLSLVPLMPNGALALAVFLPGIFLTTGPAVFAPAVLQLFTPNRMRAQVSAIYLFVVALIGMGLGPVVIGVMNDYVFGDPAALRYSIAILGIVTLPISSILFFWGAREARGLSDDD